MLRIAVHCLRQGYVENQKALLICSLRFMINGCQCLLGSACWAETLIFHLVVREDGWRTLVAAAKFKPNDRCFQARVEPA